MVRLGKQPKTSRSWVKAGEYGDPAHVSPETVIGQVSLDLVSTVYAPRIADIAESMIERYADACLSHELEVSAPGTGEAEIGPDGTTTTTTTTTASTGSSEPPPERPLFYSRASFDDFAETMEDTSEYFFAKKSPAWKMHANAAKFERMLDEKYGVFRPFITNHPELERAVRSLQRRYAMGYFSPIRQTGPPIPRTTAVVILFLMKRGGIQWQVMVLAFLFFMVGLQPWALVAVVAVAQALLSRRKNKPIGTMRSSILAIEPYYYSDGKRGDDSGADSLGSLEELTQRKRNALCGNVGEELAEGEQIDTGAYDTILLGHGAASLYTAALLSRAGRKVLVLSGRTDASGCLTLEGCKTNEKIAEKYKDVPLDVEASNIPKISRQQKMMAPALCTTTDYQGGIRFAQIGSDADGHAFEILSIPGSDGNAQKDGMLFVMKGDGGVLTLMNDAAVEAGDGWPDPDGGVGGSASGAFVAACESMNASAGLFYLSKILPDSANKLRSDPLYGESAIRYASSFLNQCFSTNARLRSLMAAIGMKDENLAPSAASMAAHVTNVSSATSGEGMHYPVGGPRALSRAFANVIEKSGGKIVTGVDLRELLFDEGDVPAQLETNDSSKKADEDSPPAPRCVGVKLSDGREVRFDKDRYANGRPDEPAVVSLLGFIDTFIRLLPEDIRTKYKVPRGLPALTERRPVFKVLFALRGTAEELSITGADYYRLPNASIALDQVDPATGIVTHGEIGGHSVDTGRNELADDTAGDVSSDGKAKDIVEDTNKNASDSAEISHPRRSKKAHHRMKYQAGTSWIHISFPSAKDPSFESRHGNVSTCVVTIEADDDFVTGFDTKPKLFVINKETAGTAGDLQRLLGRVTKDLIDVYPQLEGKIEHSEVRGPYHRGLSHNPERYAAKGVRADDSVYPRLFAGGSDLSVGESFLGAVLGGWLVANAVVGYKVLDLLFLGKNITSDLEQFLEMPSLPPPFDEEEDLAVPFDGSAEPKIDSAGESEKKDA